MYESPFLRMLKNKVVPLDPNYLHELKILRAMVRQEDGQGNEGWGGTWTKEQYRDLKEKHPESLMVFETELRLEKEKEERRRETLTKYEHSPYVEEAAGDYYRAAGRQDWDYTYDNLDVTTKRGFTREEWRKKNQWFADNNAATYNIESVNLDESSQNPLAEVAVRLTGKDGSSSVRNTYFVFEDGSWKHRFGQEEKDLFGPGLPFEEWVDAQ